jgi:hypothetical protein
MRYFCVNIFEYEEISQHTNEKQDVSLRIGLESTADYYTDA